VSGFFRAIREGDFPTLERALQQGINLNAVEYGSNALLLAIKRGDARILRRLIDAGADLHQPDAWGCTPLVLAGNLGQREAEAMLRAAGAIR
jgi:ankyrin repeat protein